MQQVMVVGAGSVGGYFGARLAKAHAHISFLLRPQTLAAVQAHGLTIRSVGGTFTVHPQAASNPAHLPAPDLIILSVKAYDVDEVMTQLEPVLTDRTVVLTLQNGVETEDRVVARLKRDAVVGGVAFIYSKIAEPGVIDHYKKGGLAIGEMMGHESARVLHIQRLFQDAGIPCQLSKDVRRSKWEKMCWNCVFNPLTVVMDDKVARALDHAEMPRVIQTIVEEVMAVAAALKVPLPSDMAERVVRWTQEIRDIHTSMYDDWKAGRKTEIDSLNGYIVHKGRELGIPTPVNEALTAIIKVITGKERVGAGLIRVDGAVVQPVSLDRRALAQLPAEYHVGDVGSLMPGMKGKAIRLKGVLEVPALGIQADHVTVHSLDGRYAVTLTLEQARDHGLLVYEVDGRPISEDHGGPFRLIAPGLDDRCANVKGVGRLEIRVGDGMESRHSKEARTHG